MVSIRVATILATAQLALAATSTTSSTSSTSSASAIPTCGYQGWDKSGGNIGYYADDASGTYSSYGVCNALCTASSDCASFAYDSGVACILYSQTAEANVALDSTSPWTFFDRGGICPSSTASSSASATSAAATATATCTGFEGYDAGSNIGYYVDAATATYSGCYAACDANSACLSFGITSNPAACILYSYTVEGNDTSYPGSGNFFYDRGGVCPSSSSSSSVVSSTTSASGLTTSTIGSSSGLSSSMTSSSATSSATTPVQSGAFPGCPSNLVPYNVNTYATPYMPCNSSYPASSCMSDNDGVNTYCNLCLSCTTQVCSTDADCGDGYACIKNSDCPVDGYTTGVAVCLYMRAGGSAFGCYDSTRNGDA